MKKVICETCNKKFDRKGGLNQHIKQVHLKIKDFDCETCGKSFSVMLLLFFILILV